MPQNIVPNFLHSHQPSAMGKPMIALLQNSGLLMILIEDAVLYIQAAKLNIYIFLYPFHVLDLYSFYSLYVLILPLPQDAITIVIINALVPRFLVQLHRHYLRQRAILFEVFADLGKLTSDVWRKAMFYFFY